MKLSKRTAVVVSAHKPYPTLELCLRGFQSIVDRREDLIFVINGSSAPLNQLAAEMFPEITVVNLSRNGLFCAGYNAGIRAALEKDYDFVLLVNADTEVVNYSFVEELLAAAGRWPKSAFLGPLVFYRNRETIQNTQFHYPSVMRSIGAWIPWRLFPNLRNRTSQREGEVDYLNDVCVLCRCTALRDFGLMDERYGGYVEDADWSWFARKNGWSSVFIPIPSIIHHEEQQGYEYFSFKSFLLKRNMVLWYLKAGYRFSACAYALASICLSWIRMISAGNSAMRRKYRQFLQHLSRTYREMIFGNSLIQYSNLATPSEEYKLEMWQ
jgi:GT2 family glycosyltransferase